MTKETRRRDKNCSVWQGTSERVVQSNHAAMALLLIWNEQDQVCRTHIDAQL